MAKYYPINRSTSRIRVTSISGDWTHCEWCRHFVGRRKAAVCHVPSAISFTSSSPAAPCRLCSSLLLHPLRLSLSISSPYLTIPPTPFYSVSPTMGFYRLRHLHPTLRLPTTIIFTPSPSYCPSYPPIALQLNAPRGKDAVWYRKWWGWRGWLWAMILLLFPCYVLSCCLICDVFVLTVFFFGWLLITLGFRCSRARGFPFLPRARETKLSIWGNIPQGKVQQSGRREPHQKNFVDLKIHIILTSIVCLGDFLVGIWRALFK